MKKIDIVEKRKVPLRNYLILIIIGIVTVSLTFYINEWVKTYNENKLSVSPLYGNVNEVNIDELNVALTEANKAILYVSYNNDKDIYKMEEKLLKKIQKEDLFNYVIYLNITDYMLNDEYLNILKTRFPNITDSIMKAPLFIYVENGEAKSIINSNKTLIDSGDFISLVEIYEIGE